MLEKTTVKFQAISEADRRLIRSTEAMAKTITICKLLCAHLYDCGKWPMGAEVDDTWRERFASQVKGGAENWHEAFAAYVGHGINVKAANTEWAIEHRIAEIVGEVCDPPLPKDNIGGWFYDPDERAALREMLDSEGLQQDLQQILDKLHRHPSYPLLYRAVARLKPTGSDPSEMDLLGRSYQDYLDELYNTRFRRP